MNEKSLRNLKSWQPGQSGNPNGRPLTGRTRLTERFLSDVSAAWERHGPKIIEEMATAERGRFAELCSRLIPRDVELSISARFPGDLSAPDWQAVKAVVRAVQQALPNANAQEPAQVMQFDWTPSTATAQS